MNLQSYDQLLLTFKNSEMENPTVYPWWLSQAYHLVKHSVNLLHFCTAESYFKNPELSAYVAKLVGGELHHDKLLLNDLKFLRKELQAESPYVRSLIANQYFQIHRYNPYYFLGYVYLLEKIAIDFGSELSRKVKEKYHGGYSFLKVHGEEDVEHVREALHFIEKLPSKDREAVFQGFNDSVVLYQNLMTQTQTQKHLSPAA
ncbi:MAG: iron-containing redox enzyme family protein [Pseudobdellovibrionaceae bacterium]